MKKKTIDVKDIEILNILTEQAELNNKELSIKIGLSEGPTLVRVRKLWERGIILSFGAIINYHSFGYNKYYLIRAEVSDTEAQELKQRLVLSRYIILLIELEASADIIMRVYLAVCQTRNMKAAKDELQVLTSGLRGIRTITFNQINFAAQKALRLEDTDIIK